MASSDHNNFCVQLVATSEKKIRRLNFKWIIKNFSFYGEENGKGFYSPEFVLDGDESYWALKCYPRGDSEDSKGSVFLGLKLLESRMAEIPAKYKISIENARGGAAISFCEMKEVRVFKSGAIWGCSEVIRHSALLDGSKGWLKDDTLTVTCYVEYAVGGFDRNFRAY